MVSAIQSIIGRINGQRSSVNQLSQPTAASESDQQVVHLFIDAGSSGKHIFPGIVFITLLLGRVALVRGAAAYSDQTFPWTICRCVGLSSALWKNSGSDPDAVWHHRSDVVQYCTITAIQYCMAYCHTVLYGVLPYSTVWQCYAYSQYKVQNHFGQKVGELGPL